VENKVLQTLAPLERVAAGAVGVGADGVEALAYQVGFLRDRAAALWVEGALDIGGGVSEEAAFATATAASALGSQAAAARAARLMRLQRRSCARMWMAWSSHCCTGGAWANWRARLMC
jgi:hypothetical protein